MKTVLVTGALGMLGYRAAQQLSRNYRVVRWDIANPAGLNLPFEIENLDLTDFESTAKAIIDLKPHAVVHTAAMINVDQCEQEPEKAHFLNSEMTANIAQAVNKIGGRLVYISTDAVFDGQKDGPYIETDTVNPLNIYGHSKLAGEKAVLTANTCNTVLRTNIYGWNIQAKTSFAEWVYYALKEGKPLSMFTDVFYSPIYTGCFAECIQAVIDKEIYGLNHAAGAEHCSKYDFAIKVAETFNLDASLIEPALLEDANLKATRNKNMRLDSTRFCKLANLEAPGLMDGLTRFRADVKILKK